MSGRRECEISRAYYPAGETDPSTPTQIMTEIRLLKRQCTCAAQFPWGSAILRWSPKIGEDVGVSHGEGRGREREQTREEAGGTWRWALTCLVFPGPERKQPGLNGTLGQGEAREEDIHVLAKAKLTPGSGQVVLNLWVETPLAVERSFRKGHM